MTKYNFLVKAYKNKELKASAYATDKKDADSKEATHKKLKGVTRVEVEELKEPREL